MKIQKPGKIVIAFLTSLIMVSCFSKDTQTELEVFTDAYVIKKMINDRPMYAVTFFAYGNQMMRSGTVTEIGGSGGYLNLGLNPNSIFTLVHWPVESDFKPYPPSATEYKFNVTAESGITNESTDYLNINDIEIPVILKTVFSDNKKLIDVTWTSVARADGYVLKVAEENGNIIYATDGMIPTVTSYTINLLTGNWTKPVESGNTYTIEVHAFAYEEDADDFYNVYNVEELSIGEKSILWEYE